MNELIIYMIWTYQKLFWSNLAATEAKLAKFPGREISHVIDFYEQNKILSLYEIQKLPARIGQITRFGCSNKTTEGGVTATLRLLYQT